MEDQETSEITQILHEWNQGDEEAKERLVPYVYDELRRQARLFMSRERRNHTLQPTALVHEAFVRLSDQAGIDWKDRNHFYGIASRLMRQILVDHAREKASQKRGRAVIHFSIDDVQIPADERAYSIVALNDALEQLESLDKRQAKIVEMRFFGGMSTKEISEVFDISERTVSREWASARLWLFRELKKT